MIRHEVRAGIFPTIGIGEMEKKNGININKWEISLSRFGIVMNKEERIDGAILDWKEYFITRN